MKTKASILFKQIAAALAAVVKSSKSMAFKNKAIAMKTRLIIFRLLRNKKVLLSAVSNKIHSALMSQEKGGETSSRAIVLFNAAREEAYPSPEHIESVEYFEDDDDEHCLFDLQDYEEEEEEEEEEDGLVDSTGSVIDWVRNSKEDGSEFNLEDEIDHVADVFIRRFHRQMRLETQESLKRCRERLRDERHRLECNELYLDLR